MSRSVSDPKNKVNADPGPDLDSLCTVETELLKLVRHLETLGRKGSLYAEVDRAGYLAMRTLERLGPVPTTALAEALHLDTSTVTRQLATLVANGFVERRADPTDGRSSRLVLTAAGQRTMHNFKHERRRVLRHMFAACTRG